MSNGASIIQFYQGLSDRKRIDFIFRNYDNLSDFIREYEDLICNRILEERAVKLREGRETLGIRVQTSVLSDPTTRDAINHSDVMQKIRDNNLDSLEKFCDNPEEMSIEVNILYQMKKDYKAVNKAMYVLNGHERKILTDMLNHDKRLCDLAEERSIEYESAKMYIYRNKRKVKKQALEFMRKMKI